MRSFTSACACLHRFTAVLGIALVMALNLLAVWPEAHAWLHGESDEECHRAPTQSGAAFSPAGHETDEESCVVTQFAHGHSGLGVAPALLAAPLVVPSAACVATDSFSASAPAHLLPPGCGPPAV
jgi:hypothetical protein